MFPGGRSFCFKNGSPYFCNKADGKKRTTSRIYRRQENEEGSMRVFGERLQWIGLGRISTLGRQSAVGAVFAQVRLPYPVQPVPQLNTWFF